MDEENTANQNLIKKEESFFCEICYETYAQNEVNQNNEISFIKLNGCNHVFCRECFQETFRSMIEEQNRHDDLKCPNFGCLTKPSVQEIQSIVSDEVFQKYLKFQQNQIVAKDQLLFFCSNENCNSIIDIRNAKKNKKLIECPNCKQQKCKKCKLNFHGEKGSCKIKNKLEDWTKNKAGVEVGKCPKCQTLIEKNGGCPDMVCYVCKYNFCWTCGFASDSFFHKMQLDTSETGFLCVIINKITHNEGFREEMWIKNMFIRYFLSLIALLVLPSILLALAITVGVICLPFAPIYYYFVDFVKCCGVCLRIDYWDECKCICVIINMIFLILTYPFILAVFIIIGAGAVVLAVLAFVLFYIVLLILVFRMIFMHCCRSKKTSNKKLKEIEKYIKLNNDHLQQYANLYPPPPPPVYQAQQPQQIVHKVPIVYQEQEEDSYYEQHQDEELRDSQDVDIENPEIQKQILEEILKHKQQSNSQLQSESLLD